MKYVPLFIFVAMFGCVADDFNNMAEGFSPPTPREAAIMAINQYDSDVRRHGITLLANSSFGGDSDYLSMYRDYVKNDRDPLVRSSAIKALARFGTPQDAILIAPWLSRSTTGSTQVRRSAANALQRLHNQQVVGYLLRSLRDVDEEPQVRSAVATALGQYPENQVFVGLISALQTNKLSINLAAAQSLHALTGQVFGTDWDAWFEWGAEIAESNGDLFAHQSAYEYPTYQHEASWWDQITFWEHRIHEEPNIPVGLGGQTGRSTYGDEATQ